MGPRQNAYRCSCNYCFIVCGRGCSCRWVLFQKSQIFIFIANKDLRIPRVKQYSSLVRLKKASVNTPSKWGDGASLRFNEKYKGKCLPVARRQGIPEDLFLRLFKQESNWHPTAESHAGAYGLAELIPLTARYLRSIFLIYIKTLMAVSVIRTNNIAHLDLGV